MRKTFLISQIIPPLITLVLSIAVAEFFVKAGIVKDYIFPAPSQVFKTLYDERILLIEAFTSTFISAGIGIAVSFLFGSFISILLSIFTFLRKAIYPYAIFFQTVPIVSISPLLVIWFGFGQPTVIASSFIVSVFPVIANTLLGLQSTDSQLVDLFKLYNTTYLDYFLKLKLPFALPYIFSGLRIASGLAIIGAVVGEFVGGGGLGGVVDAARAQQRVDLVFAAIIVSSFLGLFFIGLINCVSWLTLRKWHESEK